MEKQTLYLLREALEGAAGTGTGALEDDLFLRGAVEKFAPPPGAAAKELSREARALLTAPEKERARRLLEALSLVYTTERECGASDVPGELTPLRPGAGGYVRATCAQLRPVIAALSGSGAGRITVLEEAWAEHPEYFGDGRVLMYLARALGDTREEIEDFVTMVLAAQGKRALPFLEEGFAPDGGDGRREMERRVYWIARLGGAEENEWLLSVLPECRREVREAVIGALGVSQDNAQRLLDLYITETGKSRDAALRALARMEDDESRTFWTQELERRPDCPPCLEGVDSALAADMAALALHSAFEEALGREDSAFDQAQLLTLAHAVYAAYGKYSDAMREEWLWCAEHMAEFDRIRPGRNVRHWDMSAADMLSKCLMETVLWNPCEPVCTLACELGERLPGFFLGAAVLSELLVHPAEAFDRYGKYIVKNSLLHRESAAERANRVQIMNALAAVRFDEKNGRHILFERKDAITGASVAMRYRLPQFDPRWAETLGGSKVNKDGAVFDMGSAWKMTKLMFQPEWIE